MQKTLLLISFLLAVPLYAQPKRMTLPELTRRIKSQFQSVEGNFAIAFKNLDNPQEALFINERESFHAASTMKTPVMVELYKQAAAGKFSLDDSILVKNEFRSIVDGSPYQLEIADDSEDGLYKLIGQKLPVRQLMHEMITVSSNLATNILIELADAQSVMQTMREMGANDIRVLRGVEDGKAYEKGLNNTTTAYDLLLLFERLALGKAVNPEASQEMIEVLLQQQFNDVIPAKLPKAVKVAHKTGFITGVQHDSGIVYLPDGRQYVLVLLSKNMNDSEAGTQMLAEVSRLVYEYVAGS